MTLDILTACDWHFSKIQPLLDSLERQTTLPDRILILIYKPITKEEQELFIYYIQRMIGEDFLSLVTILSHLNSDHKPWKAHWYDRKFLLSHAKSDLSFFIDGDNLFKEDFLEKMLYRQSRLHHDLHRDVIVSPTVMLRKTQNVQSQWITWFRYFFPKYLYNKMWWEQRQEVKMMWANSLLWPTALMQSFDFDEEFAHSYEDIDFTYRLYLAGYPVIVINNIEINHMETRLWQLDKRFMWNTTVAYYRSRNRILFVKKTATFFEKTQYFWLWLWIQTVWFLTAILIRGWWKNRISLRKSVIQWTKDWLLY